jgi:5-methylcytosine-specific restriction endonuclease McrA
VTRDEHNKRKGRSSSQLCRPEKRQRIYARDGFRCLWCGRHASTRGVKLSLDHFLPRVRKGCNSTHNLLTSCTRCNSQRQDRPALEYAAERSGLFESTYDVLERILIALDTPLRRHVP